MSAQLNYIAPKFCCLLHPEIPHKSKWMPYHRYFSQYDAILTNKNVQLWLDLLEQKPEIICPPQKLKIGSRICDACCERLHSHTNDSRQNLSPKNQKLQQQQKVIITTTMNETSQQQQKQQKTRVNKKGLLNRPGTTTITTEAFSSSSNDDQTKKRETISVNNKNDARLMRAQRFATVNKETDDFIKREMQSTLIKSSNSNNKIMNKNASDENNDENELLFKNAIVVGTCMDMCPLYQVKLREKQRDLSVFELRDMKLPKADKNEPWIADESLCVKKYERSAAEKATPPPHHIRPVSVLHRTMNYLIDEIVERVIFETNDNNSKSKSIHHRSFMEVYEFLRDRCRSICQDLTYQNIRNMDSIDLHEKIVRFHIICQHRLSLEKRDMDMQPNMSLMNNYLKNLVEMYAENGARGVKCENEPEFMCYYILTRLSVAYGQSEIVRLLRRLPTYVCRSSPVQFALAISNLYQTNNWVEFFKRVKGATYLQSCVLFHLFTNMRENALRIMNSTLNIKNNPRKELFPIEDLTDMLCFDDDAETEAFCRSYDIHVSLDGVIFNESSFSYPNTHPRPQFSNRVIESKRNGMTYADIIRGKSKRDTKVIVQTSETKQKQTVSSELTLKQNDKQTNDANIQKKKKKKRRKSNDAP